MTTRKRNNPQIALRMQKAMEIRPVTFDELVVVSGLGKEAVQRWVRQLRAMRPSPIYIGGWAPDKNGRLFVPMWSWGNGADVGRPGPQRTARERMAAMRAAKKGTT